MTIYCTYVTFYSGNKLPPFYIGSTSTKKIADGYHGSIRSMKWRLIYESELKNNPQSFSSEIINIFTDRHEALANELELQKSNNVVKSPWFFNESYANVNGYFGRDVNGELNPNFNSKWTDEQKEIAKQRNLYRYNVLGVKAFGGKQSRPGSRNGRYNDKRCTYVDHSGNFLCLSPQDPLVMLKEFITMGEAKLCNIEKQKETKLKNPNMRKYSSVTVEEPSGAIIQLNWNEYSSYFTDHKLHNMFSGKRKAKGYSVIEAILNPDHKMWHNSHFKRV